MQPRHHVADPNRQGGRETRKIAGSDHINRHIYRQQVRVNRMPPTGSFTHY